MPHKGVNILTIFKTTLKVYRSAIYPHGMTSKCAGISFNGLKFKHLTETVRAGNTYNMSTRIPRILLGKNAKISFEVPTIGKGQFILNPSIMPRLLSSKALGHNDFFEKHLNPVIMLLFIR